MNAANWGRLKIVKFLLDNGAGVSARDCLGWTALTESADRGHVEVVHILLDKGADVRRRSLYGWTPLMRAALNGYPDVVRGLLDSGAEVNAGTNYGWTALMFAALKGNIDTVEVLLGGGADSGARNWKGRSALDYANAKGWTETAELLRSVRNAREHVEPPVEPLKRRHAVPEDSACALHKRTEKSPAPPTEETIESLFTERGRSLRFSYSREYNRQRKIVCEVETIMELAGLCREWGTEGSNTGRVTGKESGPSEARIGIAVVDLNHDGIGDILAYSDSSVVCNRACVYILLSDCNTWKRQRQVFPPDVEILTDCYHGHKYLRARGGGMGLTIEGEGWAQDRTIISRFDGRTYAAFLVRVRESGLAETVATWCYSQGPSRLLDVR
jgi:hypothetical protein